MKKSFIFVALFIFALGLQTVLAQFPIKIPKLPKTEKPKEQSQPQKTDGQSSEQNSQPNAGENNSTPKQNQPSQNATVKTIERPSPTNVPVFLKDSFGIDAKTENTYWKFPNQNYYSSWVPKVTFDLLYDNSSKLRYTAEWFNPDGSLWFSEPLEFYDSSRDGAITLRSADSDELFRTKSTNAIGTYGVKISNSKTGETIFQGKFKVNKQPNPEEPQKKTMAIFYVDHDWLMSLGYAGYDIEGWSEAEIYPAVIMWFKGSLEHREFEAVLYHNNQKIASTDQGAHISTIQKRGGNCYQIREICSYDLWRFTWKNFMLNNQGYLKEKYPNRLFTGDKSGEFTVKIFYKGAQVREAKFALDPNGAPVRTAFSNQIYSTMSLIPVKAMGTAEKWNPNAWKTDMFYGNPLSGFTVQ